MGALDILAKWSTYLPTMRKPKQKLTLYRRLAWTGIILVIYLVMANIPLYGVPTQALTSTISLQNIIFASSAGTLMQLGIGPIVTSGLILEVLVGAKLIDIDLSNPDDQTKFTGAMKSLAVILAVIESIVVMLSGELFPSGYSASLLVKVIIVIQLTIASYLVILMDEALQKGWGLGSAISLFILAGVAQTVIWDMFGFIPHIAMDFGVIPAIVIDKNMLVFARPNGFPDLTGLLSTFAIIILLVYLNGMRVEIPVTSSRLRGIRSRIPLQFIYVTNIPILLLAILVADLQLFETPIQRFLGISSLFYKGYSDLVYYLSPPNGIVSASSDPLRTVVFAISWLILSVIFGYLWVEVAGLNPSSQVDQLISGGLEIPGMRRNPKILESVLAKYIYPLTFLSSLIVGVIAIVAAIFGSFGTGAGILLAVGIIYQYYSIISYERALEAYPLIKRLIGEK
ncbi:MAG: preprotein translocase subunit SecY [Caldisphaera sp.]|nr:preprotein translocase subunit SecY [Caldisphaera sp.]